MGTTRIHWLDVLFNRLQPAGMLFRDGWGEPEASAAFWDEVSRRREPASIRPTLRRQRSIGPGDVYDGWFESPFGGLPAPARRVRVRLRLPRGTSSKVCLQLGAMGERGWARREWLARPLVGEGIGTALTEYAFYGSRRPPGQRAEALRCVADQFRLSASAVAESAALLGWLRQGAGLEVALAGFSMGGALAAYTAVRLPWAIPLVVAGAGSSSEDIATRDLLSRLVCWTALETRPEPRRALADALGAIALSWLPPPVAPARARLIGFRRDGVVSPASVQALHHHWAGSRLDWLDTGHVGGFALGMTAMRQAVREGFSAPDTAPAAPSLRQGVAT